jgi:energy-coupling factor transporter ATP-binding protein EcfA2
VSDTVAISQALIGLRDRLKAVRLTLDLTGAAQAQGASKELDDQIVDYLLPRLQRLDAPLLAVIGGSTGSGKSTITNSIAGADVSPAGVLRPTTRAPTLICHPDDMAWFAGDEVLADLPRVSGDSGTVSGAVLRTSPVESMNPGLAIIDAPDIDSVEEANRELATQLLASADLWLFTTTAVRYADAVPWEFLGKAQARGTALAVIINRVPVGAETEIVPHLKQMLAEGGLGDVAVYPINDAVLIDGRLPDTSIAPLKSMLTELSSNAEKRAEVVRRTVEGALASVGPRALTVVQSAQLQDQAVTELREAMELQYGQARRQLQGSLSGGTLLRNEVLDRWQELIGTNELMRAVQSRIGLIRDRIGSVLTGRSAGTNEVAGEITNTLEQLLVDLVDRASLETTETWHQLPGGDQVLGDNTELERAGGEFRGAIGAEIRAWQDDILDLVKERGQGKRTTARILAFGVNSVALALIIVLFAQTGGITGGEGAIAAGTATVSQTLLNALFGEQAVRELAAEARQKLLNRVGSLMDVDANRFRTQLWNQVSPPEVTRELAEAVQTFEDSRK